MKSHNYQKILAWLDKQNIHPSKITIQHDTWCGSSYNMRCDCQPDLIIEGKKMEYPKEILNES